MAGLRPSRLGRPAPQRARGQGADKLPGSPGSLSRSPGPTAHVSLARLVLAGLEGIAGDRGALARQAGLPAHVLGGNSARVPSEGISRLWRLGLAATSDPCLGIMVASHWRFGRLQLADYLLSTASSLAEALTVYARYADLVNSAANEVRLAVGEDGSATFTYQIRSGDPDVDAVASQFALGGVLFGVRHVAGPRVRPLRVRLPGAARPGYRDLARWLGTGRIDFDAESTAITLAPADLALPLPSADAPLAAVLREHAASVIAAHAVRPTWTARLRQDVAAHLADDGPSLPAAARRLAVSPRSLQLRLGEEGTTWREVVDGVRRDRAAVLLGQGMSRTAAAARLGFSDTRALRGALRRWGEGPGG
jgi:AraC-like DNA-binding protein